MSNKTTIGILIALIALLAVFSYVTNLGQPSHTAYVPPPPPTTLDKWNELMKVACEPSTGNPNAKWTVVELGDFQCPICGRSRPYVEKMIARSNGRAKLYFANYPLPQHEFGRAAAIASLCAEKQNKFWPMYVALYKHQDNLNPKGILQCAAEAGLDLKQFQADQISQAVEDRLQRQMGVGGFIGVSATPSFYVHENGAKTVSTFVGMVPNQNDPNTPGLRQLIIKPLWGTKTPASEIPPIKLPSQ